MLTTVKYGLRLMLGRLNAGREVTVFRDDVFLVSYPRSGNTWVRFLIANLRDPVDPASFANIDRKIPEIYHFPDRDLRRRPRPRILKSHEYFDPRYRKVIYIVRDPRDVALSFYYFLLKKRMLDDRCGIEDYVNRWIEWKAESYGSWGDNVISWLGTRHPSSGFLLVRYEDLAANPVHELGSIAGFLGIPADEGRLSRAIQLSSVGRMRALESAQSQLWQTTRKTRTDIPFVRTASTGNWKSQLPPTAVSAIESCWGSLMKQLGYALFKEEEALVATSGVLAKVQATELTSSSSVEHR